MAQFSYTARSTSGMVRKSTIEAMDQKSAMQLLKAQKLIVMEISERKSSSILTIIQNLNPLKPGVTSKELVLFSRQFSTLVSAGVPIVQGLSILVDQATSPVFKKVLKEVRGDIEQGISITESMKKHPEAFSQLYVSMIKAGELGGILDTILERLSGYLEAAEELRGKVKSAMVYPIVVMSVALFVTVFLLIFVIPTFENIFKGFGAQLPLPTRILIALSGLLRQYFLVLIAALVAVIVGFVQFRKTEKFWKKKCKPAFTVKPLSTSAKRLVLWMFRLRNLFLWLPL